MWNQLSLRDKLIKDQVTKILTIKRENDHCGIKSMTFICDPTK